jgi:hypothetical protein
MLPPCPALEARINNPPLLQGCLQELAREQMRCKEWTFYFARLAEQLASSNSGRLVIYPDADLLNTLLATVERTWQTALCIQLTPSVRPLVMVCMWEHMAAIQNYMLLT